MINVAGLQGAELAEAIQRNFDEIEDLINSSGISAASLSMFNGIDTEIIKNTELQAYFWTRGNAFGIVLQNANGDKRYFGLTQDGTGVFPVENITETE